jgi:hypothetical protein
VWLAAGTMFSALSIMATTYGRSILSRW